MIKKKMRPATNATEKLYFRKMRAVWMMRAERLLKISFYVSDTACDLGSISMIRFAVAHNKGIVDSIIEKMTIACWLRGASPSGVEEPTMS